MSDVANPHLGEKKFNLKLFEYCMLPIAKIILYYLQFTLRAYGKCSLKDVMPIL